MKESWALPEIAEARKMRSMGNNIPLLLLQVKQLMVFI
jgi:hypothetical protein